MRAYSNCKYPVSFALARTTQRIYVHNIPPYSMVYGSGTQSTDLVSASYLRYTYVFGGARSPFSTVGAAVLDAAARCDITIRYIRLHKCPNVMYPPAENVSWRAAEPLTCLKVAPSSQLFPVLSA